MMIRALLILLILGIGILDACEVGSGVGVSGGSGVGGVRGSSGRRVPLDQISSMTFYRDGMTVAVRLQSTPQLICAGGSAEGMAEYVESITCWNQNFTTSNRERYVPTWHCQNVLDINYQLESPTIACEGFDHPGDPFIVSGSCSLRYHLHYKPAPPTTRILIRTHPHPQTFWHYFTPICISGVVAALAIYLLG